MHLFEEIYYVNGMIQLYVVKLIRYSQIYEKFVVVTFGNLISWSIIYIEQWIVYWMKHDNDLEFSSLLFF